MDKSEIISYVELLGIAITLIGNVIAAVWTYVKDSEKMKDIHNDLKDGNKDLNSRVEKECRDLSDDHKEIIDNLKGGHNEIKESIAKIYAFQEKEEAVRQEAAKHMPSEFQLVDLVEKVFENNRQLRNDIDELQKELREKEHLINRQKQLIHEKDKIIEQQKIIHYEKTYNQEYDRDGYEYDRDDELER